MVSTNEDCECCVCFEQTNGLRRFNCNTCCGFVCLDCYNEIAIIDIDVDGDNVKKGEIKYNLKCPCCRTPNIKSVDDFSLDQLKSLLIESIENQVIFSSALMNIQNMIKGKKTKLCLSIKKMIEPTESLIT
jgi:hypothetical protein